ncbi:hypothetical protein C0995_007683 [Termitomyces sp. Mi166|nr:hypothetical protein C0995_007683 [Termitomyces sp. Mi166\
MRGFKFFGIILTASPFVLATDLKGSLAALAIAASFPGESSYIFSSAAYNQRFSLNPAAVVYPKTPQEVSEVIKIGASQNLKIVGRSGGHSYIANGLGGRNGSIVVDLSKFSRISVNSAQGTSVIETGNRLGDIATALAEKGRAIPHGTCAYVGIGGHAGFGGFGFTSRMWGLTLDTIKAVNLVLANGTITRVTQQNNAELFWGLRGSAPSFGIVTSYEVKTFQTPQFSTIFQYSWNLNFTAAAKGISAFQKFVNTNIPSQLGAEIVLGRGSTSGTVYFALSGGWYGSPQDLNSVLLPFLRQMPPKPSTSLKRGSYIEGVTELAGGSLDTKSAPGPRDTFYAKSLMTPATSPMSETAILAFTRYLAVTGFSSKMVCSERMISLGRGTDTNHKEWFIEIALYGGKNSAVNAVAPDATAFEHRSSLFTIQLYASSPGRRPPFPVSGFGFVDGAVNAITSNSPSNWPYSAYMNYVDDRLADWQSRYYGRHYGRLQALKAKYDPYNLFDFPTGITE